MGEARVKWLKLIAGEQPELRIIAVLLAVIAYLQWEILEESVSINRSIPYVENCGSSYNPCEVKVTNPY